MPEYRDIGSINSVTGTMQEVNTKRLTQVYQATHVGEKYLPYMNRSFISFSYGGKNIEDFSLIATIDGDRMSRDGYASFNNLTSTYDILHGQSYWGTYYKANKLSFKLATDEITQLQLDEFIYWFSADAVRELILSEHPNRAIMARIADPPQITVLPFEKKVTVLLGELTYKTSTTAYRGEISLKFIMDDPHWYSKISIFGYLNNEGIYKDEWVDANGLQRSVFDDPDAVKVALEDGIPFSTMIHDSMLLGGDTYANVDYLDYARIATMNYNPEESAAFALWRDTYEEKWENALYDEAKPAADTALYEAYPNPTEVYVKGAVIAADDAPQTPLTITIAQDTVFEDAEYTYTDYYYNEDSEEYIEITLVYTLMISRNTTVTPGLVAGPEMSQSGGIINLPANPGGSYYPQNNAFLYYPGTAPSPTEISFTLTPSTANGYINCPNNNYALSLGIDRFNVLVLESEKKLTLLFTTCGFHTAYNKAMNIFKNLSTYTSWVLVREDIRDLVRHKAVRAWANKIIDYFDPNGNDTNTISNVLNASSSASIFLEYILKDTNNEFLSSRYTFNSKTGKATAELLYRNTTGSIPNNDAGWASYGFVETHEEDVGDMLRSNYLTIREHNVLNSTGNVSAWEPNNKKVSHRIYHDVANGLQNITITYKNMYL